MSHRLSLTGNQLKSLAFCAMVFDHAALLFVPHSWDMYPFLRLPGRIAAPIMCYMVAEGFFHTSNLKKYLLRLLLFALLSHVPYALCFRHGLFETTSVLWSLFLGLLALSCVRSGRLALWQKILALLLCCALSFWANWNYVGVLWIVGFGLNRGNFRRQALTFCAVAAAAHLFVNCFCLGLLVDGNPRLYQLGVFLALPLLALYNGERGGKGKLSTWFFYAGYPLQLLLLWALRTVFP